YGISSETGNLIVTEHRLSKDGSIGTKLGQYDYDVRDRPWYKSGVKTGHPTWSDVYSWVRRNGGMSTVDIARFHPVYDSDGHLLGVIGIDIGLAQVSKFLRDGQVPRGGVAYLTGPVGAQVASSRPIPLIGPNGSRVPAEKAGSGLIAQIASAGQGNFSNK